MKLKPCPFCGGRAELQEHTSPAYKLYWCKCIKCKIGTEAHGDKEEAIEKWNTRKLVGKGEGGRRMKPCPFCGDEAELQSQALQKGNS